ncbi:hypothetical protein GLX_15000 [Komagataeibacter medellinensis NBRC 3288]|uniref:Uncharacterized protein n=2 Tax=Komagataeibacter medellinensis TaxID=1177712 RepID=G2I715_KOMMN|nr:hypothetical protein GLX_15000 [Komagataeibacter medellinensis NBRC 3288]
MAPGPRWIGTLPLQTGEDSMDFKAGDIVVVKDDAPVAPALRGMKGTVVEIIENGQIRVRGDGSGNDEWFDAASLRHE